MGSLKSKVGSKVAVARTVVEACRKMNSLGINQGKAGNISVRFKDGMLISPSGIDYDDLTATKIVEVGGDGKARGSWLPSSEWRMHHDIYGSRQEAGAVVHTHSVNCTALSCLRRSIPAFHYMIAMAGGSDIRCAAYATFGTQKLSDNMLTALKDRKACLLANHGMICFGDTLTKALALAVEVETLAAQYLTALNVGDPVLLTKRQMAEAMEAFRSYGVQPGSADRTGKLKDE